MVSRESGDVKRVDSLLASFNERILHRMECRITENNSEERCTSDYTHEPMLSYDEIRAIGAAAPSQLDAITPHTSTTDNHSKNFTFLPIITMECISCRYLLDLFVKLHSETLFSGTLQVGSFLGYTLSIDRISESCAVIGSLLNSGLGYVTSKTNKLMGLLPINRSMVILKGEMFESSHGVPIELRCLPNSLLKRSKDMPRIFRNKVKRQLSLRLNSDIATALLLLKSHHGDDCWVSSDLEQVWWLMSRANPPMLMVFELWYGDQMIAADFCHPVNGGKSVYVATRFFDRSPEIKLLQPGFLLALVECQYLKSIGCHIWDLGGVNLCPLMRYKYDLAGQPIQRPQSLFALHAAWNQPCLDKLVNMRAGCLVQDIHADDLLGIANKG